MAPGMSSRPTSFPDDVDALKALLNARDGGVRQMRDTVTMLGAWDQCTVAKNRISSSSNGQVQADAVRRKSGKLDRKIEQIGRRLQDLAA